MKKCNYFNIIVVAQKAELAITLPFQMLPVAKGDTKPENIEVSDIRCLCVRFAGVGETGIGKPIGTSGATRYELSGSAITVHVAPVEEKGEADIIIDGKYGQVNLHAKIVLNVGAGTETTTTVSPYVFSAIAAGGGGADYKTDVYMDGVGRVIVERMEDGSTVILDENENPIAKREANGTTKLFDANQGERFTIDANGNIHFAELVSLALQVASNTDAIQGIAATGGASVASSVLFNDGENAEVKVAKKTEKVRVDIVPVDQSYEFHKGDDVLNFQELNAMLQTSPDFVLFVHDNREHRCVRIELDSNPKYMEFVSPVVDSKNVKVQSFLVESVDGVQIFSVKRTDIICENKTYSDATREKLSRLSYVSGVVDEVLLPKSKQVEVVIKKGMKVDLSFDGTYGQALRFLNGSETIIQFTLQQGETSLSTTFVASADINALVTPYSSLQNVFVKYGFDEESTLNLTNELKQYNKINVGVLRDNFINSTTGEEIQATSYKCTEFIRINAVRIGVVSTTKIASVGIAFYDKNKSYVGGRDFADVDFGTFVSIDVPENAVYFRNCAINSEANNMEVYNTLTADALNRCALISNNPCFYNESEEARVFNKVLFIGDSLTDGQFDYHEGSVRREVNKREYSVPTYFAAISGRETTNKGDAGETTKTWWELHGNEDFSGHDAALIALGRNDYVQGRETTAEERALYMGNIISKLKQDNPQIKIFIATMINYYNGADADAVNESMRDIANSTDDCYLVDISRYGKLVENVDNLSHCTAVGYSKIARYYYNYISYIMAKNPSDFKFVQFAGTNLHW